MRHFLFSSGKNSNTTSRLASSAFITDLHIVHSRISKKHFCKVSELADAISDNLSPRSSLLPLDRLHAATQEPSFLIENLRITLTSLSAEKWACTHIRNMPSGQNQASDWCGLRVLISTVIITQYKALYSRSVAPDLLWWEINATILIKHPLQGSNCWAHSRLDECMRCKCRHYVQVRRGLVVFLRCSCKISRVCSIGRARHALLRLMPSITSIFLHLRPESFGSSKASIQPHDICSTHVHVFWCMWRVM